MNVYECTGKNRDKQGKIISYNLTDQCGEKSVVKADILKLNLQVRRIIVKNLKLTSDNRIIDVKPSELKGYLYKASYGDEVLYPYIGRYTNDGLCLGFLSKNENGDLEHYCRVTTNVIDLPYLHALIDTNNNGDKMVEFLVKNGFGRPTGKYIPSGFCRYPVFLFNAKKLEEIDRVAFEQYKYSNR